MICFAEVVVGETEMVKFWKRKSVKKNVKLDHNNVHKND